MGVATNERTVTHGQNLPGLDAGCWLVLREAVRGNSVAATNSTQSRRNGYSTLNVLNEERAAGLSRGGHPSDGSSNGRRLLRSWIRNQPIEERQKLPAPCAESLSISPPAGSVLPTPAC